MNKRLLVIVGVVSAIVAALAVGYVAGSRVGEADDRGLAQAAADQIACTGAPPCNEVRDLHRIASGVWRFRVVPDGRCITITLDDFRISNDGERVDGAARSRC